MSPQLATYLRCLLQVTIFVVIEITIVVGGFLVRVYERTRQSLYKVTSHKDVVPGPMPFPLFGTTWVYSPFGGYTFSRVHEFYRDMRSKYGDIMKEEVVWNIPVINVFARADIEKVLKSSSKYPIRPPTEAIAQYRLSRKDRYASAGIVNEQGPTWQFLRINLTGELTSTKAISAYLPELQHIADDFCNLIYAMRKPNNVVDNFEELASRIGLESICCLVLGRRMGFLINDENKQTDIQKRLAEAVANQFVACRDTYYGLPLWRYFSTRAYRQLIHSEEEIYNLVLEIIHSADMDDSDISTVFHSVLNANIDERDKTAAIVDFIAAGIYTMRNSLVFLLDIVSRHPSCHDKLVQDSDYLRACVNEAFRLNPTAMCLARVTEKELELGGYRFNPGTVVLCQTGIACRDAANFPRPNEFVPERWLDDAKQETSSAATFLVLPFGVGRRTCPGKRFMEQTLPVILKRVISQFDVRPTQNLEVQFEFLMAPKPPVSMLFKDR